jgi:hypothetical protein
MIYVAIILLVALAWLSCGTNYGFSLLNLDRHG